ncbi:hypothetical protein [Methanoculleus sp.]|uniref:hypothetical protein n=1 Tax=Methanoculleus sp. TaxID=90427 RepID=UPI001BD27674|nr:hypothetical protein [Methanoculleus sp.]
MRIITQVGKISIYILLFGNISKLTKLILVKIKLKTFIVGDRAGVPFQNPQKGEET